MGFDGKQTLEKLCTAAQRIYVLEIQWDLHVRFFQRRMDLSTMLRKLNSELTGLI
jgi:hypothetical protein